MSFFLRYKTNSMLNNDEIITIDTPHDRFQFQQVPANKAQEFMLIRFLSEYGPEVPENDPEEVLIFSFAHTQSNGNHHLEIEYQMNGKGYQVEVEFNYSPTPNPDFFKNVAFEDLEIYQISNNTLT